MSQATRPMQQASRSGDSGKKRAITLTLSPAQLLSAIAGFGIVLVWVFILGVIMGKGYTPEAHIPEIERLMPKGEGIEPPRVITQETQAAAQDAADAAAHEAGMQVIQPGDMAYRQSLKNSSTQQPRQTAQAPAQQQQARQNTPVQTPAQQQQTPAQQQQAATPQANAQVFNYVYQVAAYKDQTPCDALTAKLTKAGFTASTEKSQNNGSTWYKTLIHFRGTPDDVDTLRAGLSAHKLDRLILRSKSPVQR